jgi:hypothetical protein
LRSKSGCFATFIAVRLASSFVSNFADDLLPGSFSKLPDGRSCLSFCLGDKQPRLVAGERLGCNPAQSLFFISRYSAKIDCRVSPANVQ